MASVFLNLSAAILTLVTNLDDDRLQNLTSHNTQTTTAAGIQVVDRPGPPDVVQPPIGGGDGLLETRLGLTPAEASVARALARGLTLAEHAADQGVSINTARTLLRRAMAKAGCRRQA